MNILVTGISRGLGRVLCESFVEHGHRVAGCARDSVAISELQQTFASGSESNTSNAEQPQTHLSAVNLNSDTAVAEWINTVVEQWGVPDLVINNAAIISENMPLWELPFAEFESLMATNVNSVFSVIRHVLPHMFENGSGIIANISSGWGRSVSADVAAYCASKWAIEGLTQALAEDLPSGFAAVPVNPGIINTEMLQSCFGESANNAPTPNAWVKRAVPFFLNLSTADNGQPLSI